MIWWSYLLLLVLNTGTLWVLPILYLAQPGWVTLERDRYLFALICYGFHLVFAWSILAEQEGEPEEAPFYWPVWVAGIGTGAAILAWVTGFPGWGPALVGGLAGAAGVALFELGYRRVAGPETWLNYLVSQGLGLILLLPLFFFAASFWSTPPRLRVATALAAAAAAILIAQAWFLARYPRARVLGLLALHHEANPKALDLWLGLGMLVAPFLAYFGFLFLVAALPQKLIFLICGSLILACLILWALGFDRPSSGRVSPSGEIGGNFSLSTTDPPPHGSRRPTREPRVYPDPLLIDDLLDPETDSLLYTPSRIAFIDRDGRVVLEIGDASASHHGDGMIAIQPFSARDRHGQVLFQNPGVPTTNSDWLVGGFGDGRALFRKGDLLGYVDYQGQPVIPARFAQARSFREGLAAAMEEGKWGFLDIEGNWAIPPRFSLSPQPVRDFHEDRAAICQNGRWGFIGKEGRIVVSPFFDEVGEFSEGRAAVLTEGRWGFIDRAGNLVIPPRYSEVGPFGSGRARFCGDRQQLFGFLDLEGAEIILPRFSRARDFSEGVAWVSEAPRGTRWQILEIGGCIAHAGDYDHVSDSHGQRLVCRAVATSPLSGYLTQTGSVAIPPRFRSAWDFHEGLARVVLVS